MAGNDRNYFEDLKNGDILKYTQKIIDFKNNLGSEKQSTNATTWLRWAKSHRSLKTVSVDVPPGILPKGVSGKLHDVKVSSRGPDDAVYDGNKELRQKVARGNCFLELYEDKKTSVRCVTFALKKFTGGLGDDDDRDIGDGKTWQRYFLKPLDSSTKIVCTRKANGEAAHLSGVRINGEKLVCCGSKNVHMLVRNRADITKYEGERYNIASEVCSSIFDTLESLDKDASDRLLEFLCDTELTGVFEILNPNHQHVEDFSKMTSPEMKFIVWTTFNTLYEEEEELCCMPPHVAIDTARALGLSTVDYEIIDIESVDDRMKQVRRDYGYEGEVLYFLDENDSVIGLLKKKTIWYILCRAIREKLRGAIIGAEKKPDTFSVNKFHRKISSRVSEIQKWLGLDDDSTQKWKNLGTSCLSWVIDRHSHGQLGRGDIAEKFPVTWRRFLEDHDMTDKIDTDSRDLDVNEEENQTAELSKAADGIDGDSSNEDH